MSQPQPHMDFQDIRTAAHKLAEHRRDARRDFERYAEQEADADRDYRKTQAIAFAEAKSEGLSDKRAEVAMNSKAADAKHRRDIAKSLAKSALLRIEELEADRAMLRQLGDWSQRMEHVAP